MNNFLSAEYISTPVLIPTQYTSNDKICQYKNFIKQLQTGIAFF